MKLKTFYFHFNKPQTQISNKTIWSLHFDNKCHYVEQIISKVPSKTRSRKYQPKAIVSGSYNNITIKDGVATIT